MIKKMELVSTFITYYYLLSYEMLDQFLVDLALIENSNFYGLSF